MRARTKPPGRAQPPCSRYVTPSTSSACHWTRPTLMPSSSSSRSTSTSTSRPTNRVNRSAEIARCTSTIRSEEHTSELQSHVNLVCRLLLEKKKKKNNLTKKKKKEKQKVT